MAKLKFLSSEAGVVTSTLESRYGVLTVLLDEDVYDTFKDLYILPTSTNKSKGLIYLTVRLDGNRTPLRLHRLISNPQGAEIVDHINGNTLDNTRINLRNCNYSDNQLNSRGHLNRSLSKGVYKASKNTWKVEGKHAGVYYYLGYFSSEQAAINARKEYLDKLGVIYK